MHLAYQVVGDGPIDLVYVPAWFSHVELLWEEPSVASFFERLASFSRLIMFDRRGAGLSDPIAGPVTLEEQMDDVACVMDAADSERAGVFAQLEGGSMATLFAATHPERVGALILYSAFARTAWAPDYDWPPTPAAREVRLEEQLLPAWGQGVLAAVFAPSLAHDGQFREWFGRLERYAASPATVRNIFASIGETDVRGVLSTIRVPTLVMHRRDDSLVPVELGRDVAASIPGARFVELPGAEIGRAHV